MAFLAEEVTPRWGSSNADGQHRSPKHGQQRSTEPLFLVPITVELNGLVIGIGGSGSRETTGPIQALTPSDHPRVTTRNVPGHSAVGSARGGPEHADGAEVEPVAYGQRPGCGVEHDPARKAPRGCGVRLVP